MPKKDQVLVIGTIDIVTLLSMKDHYEITYAANYEEAIEPLKKRFDHVITDAVLSGGRTGLDVLLLIKELHGVKERPRTTVCHPEETCIDHGQTWFIESCLRAHYVFADFHQGTIEDSLVKRLKQPLRKCA
jgi:hypothetical protein